jgi:hypothetical protein
MSNKMKRNLILLLLICLGAGAYGFTPQRGDFDSEYQYRLHQSWLARETVERELPSRITTQYVERHLKYEISKEVKVIYNWDNWKINSQREDLPSWLPFSSYKTELIIASELLYRLNCRHKIFARNYLDMLPVSIMYQGNRGDSALDSLWARFPDRRLPLEKLHPVIHKESLAQLILELENGDEVIIIFNQLNRYPADRLRMSEYEKDIAEYLLPTDFSRSTREIITHSIPQKVQIEADEFPAFTPEQARPDTHSTQDTKKDTNLTNYEKELINWIEDNLSTSWGTEMINNKIVSIKDFLQSEFKSHSLLIKNNEYYLNHSLFAGNLNANLYFKITDNGGWAIKAADDIVIDGKNVVLAGFEDYDLSDLELYDIHAIARYLPQLIMSHRVMASRLAGFIFEPDIAETTLVVQGSARQVFQLDSYRDLLMLLGRYWQDRIIYYNISDFKLIDGFIEFKGYLAAEKTADGEYDLAEIRYRLDEDYAIVLAMVVVFPQQSSQKIQG